MPQVSGLLCEFSYGKIYKTISQRKSCRCSYYASSVSGGDDNLHEKTWYEASTYNSCDDRLYMYSVWEETNCDYYITPHESLNGEIIKRGIKKEKLRSFGIPVSLSCNDNIEKNRQKISFRLTKIKIYTCVRWKHGCR